MTASNPGPDPDGYAQAPNDPSGASDGGLGTVLRTVVLAAGALVSLVAFAKFYNYDGTAGYNVTPALLPLTAALLTGASLLPRQTEQRAAVAAVAMAGFVTTLFAALQPPISLSLAGAA